MSCSGGIKYQVIIEEDGKIIYNKFFSSDSILKVKANRGSRYVVTIDNESNKILSGKVKINSYVRQIGGKIMDLNPMRYSNGDQFRCYIL